MKMFIFIFVLLAQTPAFAQSDICSVDFESRYVTFVSHMEEWMNVEEKDRPAIDLKLEKDCQEIVALKDKLKSIECYARHNQQLITGQSIINACKNLGIGI